MRQDWRQRGWLLPFPICPWESTLYAGPLAVLLLSAASWSWAQESHRGTHPRLGVRSQRQLSGLSSTPAAWAFTGSRNSCRGPAVLP
jgi:hypothetical protein